MNQEYKVNLSQGQKAKLAKAIKDGSALKLRLGKNSLSGNDELLLSPRQIAKLQKAKKNNTGAEISFSKSAIRKSIKQGGSLWTSLLKLTPFLTKGVSKVAPHLATGAVSALGSLGIDKIFGKGMQGGTLAGKFNRYFILVISLKTWRQISSLSFIFEANNRISAIKYIGHLLFPKYKIKYCLCSLAVISLRFST